MRDGAAARGADAGGGFAVDSPAGRHAVQPLGDDHYRIDMGRPEFEPARIPLHGYAARQDQYVLDLHDTVFVFGAVSMGNPHAVIEVDEVDAAPVESIGPWLQSSPAFPESANIGFAQVIAPDRIALRVYERGSGETLACGTGACATAAVSIEIGRDPTPSAPSPPRRCGMRPTATRSSRAPTRTCATRRGCSWWRRYPSCSSNREKNALVIAVGPWSATNWRSWRTSSMRLTARERWSAENSWSR